MTAANKSEMQYKSDKVASLNFFLQRSTVVII